MEKNKTYHYLQVDEFKRIRANLMYQKIGEEYFGFLFGYSGGGQFIDAFFKINEKNKIKLKEDLESFKKTDQDIIYNIYDEGCIYQNHKGVCDEVQNELRGKITIDGIELEKYSKKIDGGWLFFTEEIEFSIVRKIIDKSDLLLYF